MPSNVIHVRFAVVKIPNREGMDLRTYELPQAEWQLLQAVRDRLGSKAQAALAGVLCNGHTLLHLPTREQEEILQIVKEKGFELP